MLQGLGDWAVLFLVQAQQQLAVAARLEHLGQQQRQELLGLCPPIIFMAALVAVGAVPLQQALVVQGVMVAIQAQAAAVAVRQTQALTLALAALAQMVMPESSHSSKINMPKQFLLNPDGSIPANTNIDLLKIEGIPLVMPTPMPRESGMIAVEQDPQQDSNGLWHQIWVLEPVQDQEMEQ
jgi:hypothetical protein